MPNVDPQDARIRPALESRRSIPQDQVRGRSGAVYAVLMALKDGRIHTSGDVAGAAGMKARNANRVLLSLYRWGQVERPESPEYEPSERADGHPVPSRKAYRYRITDKGRARMEWLEANEPWEAGNE